MKRTKLGGVKKINQKSKCDGWVWIHLDRDNRATTKWLNKYQSMQHSAAEVLGCPRPRTHSYVFERGIFLILRGINLNAREKAENIFSMSLWMNDKIVNTTRRKKLIAVDAIRKEITAGNCPNTPAHLVIDLVHGLTNRITEQVESLDDQITILKDSEDESALETVQNKVQTIRLQAAIASKQTELLNKTMYSVFFLPLSLFTVLLGINVSGMPSDGCPPPSTLC
ncbi:MAG: hypothetical protein GY927_05725 [bacterium]|nr:hypothetical protein [bacterium]